MITLTNHDIECLKKAITNGEWIHMKCGISVYPVSDSDDDFIIITADVDIKGDVLEIERPGNGIVYMWVYDGDSMIGLVKAWVTTDKYRISPDAPKMTIGDKRFGCSFIERVGRILRR